MKAVPMNFRVFILHLVLLFPVTVCLAQTGSVSFDAGVLINTPRLPEYKWTMPEGTTTSAEWNYRYTTTTSPYFRVSYRHSSGTNKLKLQFPIALAAMAADRTYHLSGYSWGCFGGEQYTGWVHEKKQLISFSIGPEVSYTTGKSRMATSLSLHQQYTFLDYMERSDLRTNNQHSLAMNMSSGLSYAYRFGGMWIGPAVEVFHGSPYSIVRAIRGKATPSYYGPRTDLFLWIAPSVRMTIEL